MSNLANRTVGTERPAEYRSASPRGLARPGALQMLVGVAGLMIESIGPLILAAVHRPHDFELFLTGGPAFAFFAVSAVLVVLYFVGFLRYTASKGYSMWLGLLLFVCNVPGLLILLLLPDRR